MFSLTFCHNHSVALIVLLNVGRHAHLAASLACCSDATDALVDMLQMFRDKRSLFILAAELLTRLVSASAETKVGRVPSVGLCILQLLLFFYIYYICLHIYILYNYPILCIYS